MPKKITKPHPYRLRVLYEEDKLNGAEIGKLFKAKRTTVYSWLRSYGVKIRKRPTIGEMTTRKTERKLLSRTGNSIRKSILLTKHLRCGLAMKQTGLCKNTIIRYRKKYGVYYGNFKRARVC